MKIILLLITIFSCVLKEAAEGQQNIQFIYVGSKQYSPEGVLITSAGFRCYFLKNKDSLLTKIYYTNQMILDSLKAYISRSKWIKHAATCTTENDRIDTVDAFKIIGVDASPLYVQGPDCNELCLSAMTYLTNSGWINTSGWNAFHDLLFQCRETPFHRDEYLKQSHQIEDTFRILDGTRVRASPRN